MLRHHEDARDVVPLRRELLLTEVAGEGLLPPLDLLAEHIEEEGVDVIVESLVVEKKLGEQAQALAVHLGRRAVHLVHCQIHRLCKPRLLGTLRHGRSRRRIHLLARWPSPFNGGQMGGVGRTSLEVLKRERADEQPRLLGERVWVRREVPVARGQQPRMSSAVAGRAAKRRTSSACAGTRDVSLGRDPRSAPSRTMCRSRSGPSR